MGGPQLLNQRRRGIERAKARESPINRAGSRSLSIGFGASIYTDKVGGTINPTRGNARERFPSIPMQDVWSDRSDSIEVSHVRRSSRLPLGNRTNEMLIKLYHLAAVVSLI